ncbi:NADP(+) coupled glycerol dehydrogenase [Penicillium malachiteum]|uniref:D-xylose reductase [NAD(P)H] n=1 Tax=Penicillium malachiteum TaxID=1324776 RepID=A0AAD6MX18_9EURO|nr:NADP(+) coupled glycerol dehydrogenase [Penicillium malachiteum]
MREGKPKYHVALIGLGSRGYKTWFSSLQKTSSIAVTAVCDNNPKTIESFASRHPDIPAYTCLDQLIQHQRPLFSILSIPNRVHADFVARLSAAGIPVLKEKPIAECAMDFQNLCAYAATTGVVFQRRCQPQYLYLKDFLPKLGKLISIRASIVGQDDPPEDSWRMMDNVGTFVSSLPPRIHDVFRSTQISLSTKDDLGVHMLDVLVWLFGRPSTVLAQQATDGPPGSRDRETNAVMRWNSSDVVGNLYVSEVALHKEESLLVRGEFGSLHLKDNEISHFDSSGGRRFYMEIENRKEDSVEAMCREFGDYLLGISPTFPTLLRQVADTVATSEAVNASVQSYQQENVQPVYPSVVSPPNTAPSAARHINGVKQMNGVQHMNGTPIDEDLDIAQRRFTLNTGDKIPALGFGTRRPKQPKQTYNAVKEALSIGYRHIDTAFLYNNEDQVGQPVRNSGLPRESIWITTKVDNSWHHRVADSVDLSLQAMGLEYIDLLLMHWPTAIDPEDPKNSLPNWDFTMTWQHMQDAVRSGRVRNIGVSNFGIRNLKKLMAHPLCTIVPAVNQIELHSSCPSDGLIKFCKQNGIHCTAYSPLASALPVLHESAVMTELCKRKGKTSQQILIMWALQRGTSAIPKSIIPERIAGNFDLQG